MIPMTSGNCRIRSLIAECFGGASWGRWLGLVGLGVLFVALRWNNGNAPLIRDEGEYAYAAQLLDQGMAPYEHAFIQKPPMIVYSYALSHFLFPSIYWGPRLLAGAFVALTTLLLGVIARLEFGAGFARPAMWLVTPMILLPGIEQFTANTEMFMLLPLLATIALYCYSRHAGVKPRLWFAAGFLGVTTLCYKYTALLLLVMIFAVWSVEMWRASRSLNRVGRCWLAAVGGGVVAAGVILGFFLIHDGGRQLWECTVQFNRYYVESNNFAWTAIGSRLKGFWPDWWILFLVLPGVFLKPNRRIWFWLGMMICAFASTGGSSFGHYYVVVMPFWALLAAVGIGSLTLPIAHWLSRPAAGIGIALTAVVVLILLLPDAPWMMSSPGRFVAGKLGAHSSFLASPGVAGRVAELSSPDDFVLVAGSEPQILCYARRFSPTRFITAYPLVIPSPLAQNYQREAIRDLQERPPALIVMTHSWLQEATPTPEFLIFLNQLLDQNYERVGGYVFNGQKGRWMEPLTDEAAAAANMVLFKRKTFPSQPD